MHARQIAQLCFQAAFFFQVIQDLIVQRGFLGAVALCDKGTDQLVQLSMIHICQSEGFHHRGIAFGIYGRCQGCNLAGRLCERLDRIPIPVDLTAA